MSYTVNANLFYFSNKKMIIVGLKMDFEVLIDDTFINICTDNQLQPINNKKVLSLINDFEDGKWRYKKFQNFIWDNIAETSLSHQERRCLVDQSHSLLTAAARNLRLTDSIDDISQGSELAEIVLYGIMKHYYSALPIVPKIFYKQNSQDNAKGADSVHIVIEDENNFSLWFGEAKFYNSIEDNRLLSIITSVANSLKTDKLEKENSIITNLSDLDSLVMNEELKTKIKKALSNKSSIDDIKPKLHIPILLLHVCDFTKKANKLTNEYKNQISTYHKKRANSYFEKQINNLKSNVFLYSDIKFHLILFPVPEKDDIVNKFIENVKHYKEQ
jgi:Cap4 SAVED domain